MRNKPRLVRCLQHFCSLSEGEKKPLIPTFFRQKFQNSVSWNGGKGAFPRPEQIPVGWVVPGAAPRGAGSSSMRCWCTELSCRSTKPSRCKSSSREHQLRPELFPVWTSSR